MKVVVVEDNADLQYLVKFHLHEEGFDVVQVVDRWEQLFDHEFWVGVDVAVVDLHLNDDTVTGATVLRWLKEHRPHIRRLVFTAALMPNELPSVPELADLGVYVSKLETPGAFVRAVRGDDT